MNDLSIRVSATDMASNVLAAVGENVKTLGQTASNSFDLMRASGQEATLAANNASQGSTLIVGGAGALSAVAGVLTSVAGSALIAAGAIAGIGVAALRAADKAEKELDKVGKTLKLIEAQRLNIPVEIVGAGAIDPILAKVKEVANQLEIATGTKSSKIVDLSSSAVKMGFNPGEIDQTMKGAAGLASAFGTSLEDGLSKVRQAAEGNFAAFETLIPGIETLTTDQEKLAAVSKLAADGLTLSVQAANDGAGIFSKLGNGVGNLLERIGEGASVTEIFAGVLGEILYPVVDFVDQKLVALGTTGDWLKDTLKNSFAFVSAAAQMTWGNIGLLLERGKLSFLLFAEQSALSIEHAFTVSMPSYVLWFTDNFFNLLQDLASGALTIVSNLGQNIADAFGAYWHYITEGWSQGDSLGDLATNIGNIATRNLLEGFEPVTTELPEIAERAMSLTEKSLLDQMAGIDRKLADDFTSAFNDSLQGIDRQLTAAKLDTKINLAKVKPPKPEDLIPQGVEAKVNQAFESRILVRGPSDDPMAKSLAVQEKMLEKLESIAASNESAKMLKESQTGFGNSFSDAFEIDLSGGT